MNTVTMSTANLDAIVKTLAGLKGVKIDSTPDAVKAFAPDSRCVLDAQRKSAEGWLVSYAGKLIQTV